MRHGHLVFEYVCDSESVNAARVGTDQIYSGRADYFDPPTLTQDSATQFSSRGNRKGTTVFGEWMEGSFRIPVVSGDRLPIVMEFLESIRGEREFIIRADNLPGVMRALSVFIPVSSYPLKRLKGCDRYELKLKYRTINEPITNSVAASMLVAGTVDRIARGQGFAGVQVGRFAYYVFDGTEAARNISYGLTCESEVVVTVNGHELNRYSGNFPSHTHSITSAMQLAGTNSLRFECREVTANWSVDNVLIT